MKKNILTHVVIIVLEIIALIHDVKAFGLGMFTHYTIDSNILQLVVSACIVYVLVLKKRPTVGAPLKALHQTAAVCLTITFLIALLVLAPQEGFDYYFFENVAPINHGLGPLLSVVTFLFLDRSPLLPKQYVIAPMCATLLYGIIMLVLNVFRVVDGPYFFLRVHETPIGTVLLWFVIIAVLCMSLSWLYMRITEFLEKRRRRGQSPLD